MAIAVPFLLAAAEVGTVATVLTTVAFAVTGVSDKINKAAASVFGEDLVKVANIAGAAYGAFNGGFDIGDGFKQASSLADAATPIESAYSNEQALSDAIGGGTDLAAMPVDQVAAASQGADVVSQADQLGAPGVDTFDPNAFKPGGLNAIGSGSQPSFNLSNLNAGLPDTTSSVISQPTQDWTSGITRAQASLGPTLDAAAALPSNNISDQLLALIKNKDGTISNGALMAGGNIIQGAFGGYSAAKAREQAQANYDAQVARQARLANLGTGGWKQTQ